MKTLFTFILLIGISFSTFSQVSFPTEKALWHGGGISIGWGNGELSPLNFGIIGDTIIGNQAYSKFFQLHLYPIDNSCLLNLVGFLRSEGSKVYFQDLNSNEILLYDFSLTVGDTITLEPFGSIGSGSWNMVVDDVGTIITADGVERKTIHFLNGSHEEVWIEGIGSTDGFITRGFYTDGGLITDYDPYFYCFKHNNVDVYQHNNNVPCIDFVFDEDPTTSCPTCYSPTNININAISGNCVKLDWTRSGSGFRYRLRYRTIGGTWIEGLTKTNETYRFFNGLLPNTSYEFQIKSLCYLINSNWSDSYMITTAEDICDLPESASATLMTDGKVSFNWPADLDDQKYKFKYKPSNNSMAWTEYTNVTSNFIIESGLTMGTEYRYKLKTRCSNGWTQWTEKFSFTPTSVVQPTFRTSENEFTIYPNPYSEVIRVHSRKSINQNTVVQLVDLNGRLIPINIDFNNEEIVIAPRIKKQGVFVLQLFDKKTKEILLRKKITSF